MIASAGASGWSLGDLERGGGPSNTLLMTGNWRTSGVHVLWEAPGIQSSIPHLINLMWLSTENPKIKTDWVFLFVLFLRIILMADSPFVPGKLNDSASTNKLLLNFLDGYCLFKHLKKNRLSIWNNKSWHLQSTLVKST